MALFSTNLSPVQVRLQAILMLVPAAMIQPAIAGEPEVSPASELSRPSEQGGSAMPPFAVVGSIQLSNGNIFNLDIAEENRALFRLANRLHFRTREDVIMQQLLFAEGERVSKSELDESERILRSNRYLQDASITTTPRESGLVDVNIETSDVWTLIPKISLSRSGGENNTGVGVKEMNLFGSGIEVEALYKSTVDRESRLLKYVDRNIGNSWYSVHAVYGDNSDGHTQLIDLHKPFYSLDSRDAHGVLFFDNDEIETLYDRGLKAGQFRHRAQKAEVFSGWSRGLFGGSTTRLSAGLAYEDHRFEAVPGDTLQFSIVPADRKFAYPFVGLEYVEDRFEKTVNVNQISRTEDRFLGTRLTGRVGYANAGFGSSQDAWMIALNGQTGFGNSDTQSLILASELNTRVEDSGLANFRFDASAEYFRRQSDKRLFYASLRGTFGQELDADQQILLGGDTGLRGYPLRYLSGNRSALLSLEQRFFTDWYPFRLVHVGGAVFFDAGKTWGNRFAADSDDTVLKDIGVGLRLGNTRSGQGRMTHIDLAFPLDGDRDIDSLQFLIETRKSF